MPSQGREQSSGKRGFICLMPSQGREQSSGKRGHMIGDNSGKTAFLVARRCAVAPLRLCALAPLRFVARFDYPIRKVSWTWVLRNLTSRRGILISCKSLTYELVVEAGKWSSGSSPSLITCWAGCFRRIESLIIEEGEAPNIYLS